MPESRRLLLRVLYTINSSSYILARSPVPVSVTLINEDEPEIQPYGIVSFKTCLEAICRSSPEVMQDRTKDFSVYVLDPLESNVPPAPLDISNATGSRSTDAAGVAAAERSSGVAVGMGLMSWALSQEEKEPITVVGTLGKTGTGQDAIEVIVALRELFTQHPGASNLLPAPANALPSEETLATIASIQNRTKPKTKPKKPPRVSSTPVTESDKLLSADTYIGPVRKKGRPKGQTNSESKIKPEATAAVPSQDTSSAAPNPASDPHPGGPTTATVQPTPYIDLTAAPTQDLSSPPVNGLDLSVLAALFSSSQNEAVQNTVLLHALSLIDNSNTQQDEAQPAVNPALVDALRQILTNLYNQTPSGNPPAPSVSPTVPAPTNVPPSSGSGNETVPLDKENVNPIVRQNSGQFVKPTGDVVSSNDSITEAVIQSRGGLGARSIQNSPPKPVPTSTPLSSSSTNTRKRTLDDCMEERDNKRNKNQRAKLKEKERPEKKDTSRLLGQQSNSENGLKYYPRFMLDSYRPQPGSISYYRMPIETFTSPPPPLSEKTPILRPNTSSPIKPTNGSKKPYVVPSWARTNTALKPRLSEETQKAIEDAAGRKREEKLANRRKSNARAADRHRQREKMASSEILDTCSEPPGPPNSHESMQPPPLPIIPNSDLPPIIASSDADLIMFPPVNPRAQSPPPSRTTILLPPVTPKRSSKVASSTPSADDFDEDSLFTPLSIARRSTGKSGSPLFSPGIMGSPLAQKRSKVLSPISYRMTTKQLGSESSTITVKAHDTSEDTCHKSKSPAPDLDDAQEELECPPSSLPIASSDSEYEDATMQSAPAANDQTADELDNIDEGLPPRKQHWVGLPPSSPPPPTSPCLMPIDDDGELQLEEIGEELPIASETDEPEEEDVGDEDMQNTIESDWSPSPADADDFTVTLPVPAETSEITASDQEEDVDEMAFLREFTTLGSSDSLTEGDGGMQENQNLSADDINSLFASCGNNLDFEAFFEGFKALEGAPSETPGQSSDFDLSAIEGLSDGQTLESIDHHKMAADLQAILSGCVV
ncbi:hypothetical protein NP233_g4943 [Leucocoprinus birnbaumii]|uniref:BZIP domain-containing protein n=1 Tax=Leucocoprinus birnbaumii TaxID=56174 RepID=A0AAD5VXF5_9AGAR|nr:hypothetical protein NP233_g4943 [Leucocoprinus birnbaumii]